MKSEGTSGFFLSQIASQLNATSLLFHFLFTNWTVEHISGSHLIQIIAFDSSVTGTDTFDTEWIQTHFLISSLPLWILATWLNITGITIILMSSTDHHRIRFVNPRMSLKEPVSREV